MTEDKRITLLKRLVTEGKTTAEFKANPYLRELFNDTDLGSLRRTLEDLVDAQFIGLSSINDSSPKTWLQSHLDTTSERNKEPKYNASKKSIDRLVKDLGNVTAHKQVKLIRLFITVQGIKFLLDYENSELQKSLTQLQIKDTSRKVKYWRVAVFASLLALLISIFSIVLDFNASKPIDKVVPIHSTSDSRQTQSSPASEF